LNRLLLPQPPKANAKPKSASALAQLRTACPLRSLPIPTHAS
jgi:hypothetical protein